MKKLLQHSITVAFLCGISLSVAASGPKPKKFLHPAILNTKASLDRISKEVDKGDAVRVAAYKRVEEFIERSDYPTAYFSTIVVGSNGATSPSKSQIRRDAELVYAFALAWAKTGKPEYAEKAIGLINGWSYAFKNYDLLNAATNKRQPGLEACWTTPGFVAAAEILRYYKVDGKSAGWKAADIAQFGNYLRTVVGEYINVMPIYNNNWNASQGYAKMAIGIFLDSTALYQEGYDITAKFMPIVIKQNGDIPEYCDRKDCVHFQYSLTAFSYAAQLAQLQGDKSLWEFGERLMARGYDYMRKAWDNQAECSFCSANSKIFPGVEVAANYYKTANLDYLRQLQAPLGWPGDYTFLGFTTYTHFEVSFK
ncbi:Alginate lyase [Chitinophaga jiangningensis]|uniref:Alginate lyase n=1 Tax=Chitinophaga jiangningensis TaxID=1419482 RepID=A0A1M7G785_9BACT|nr:alginate lyase family protein [Chitinophaga jiangningensis]SHM12046.1 Alginate lyase [Chitinophaga jiangningensis]